MDVTLSSDEGPRTPPRDGIEEIEARVLLEDLRAQMFGRGEPPRVGRFVLRERLGQGAHGSVYLADDTRLQRRVALKLLRGETHHVARARLLREAQALARLKHPNVLTIHDVGVEGDRVFVAMEYVEAGTLARWCEQHPPGTRARFREVLRLAIDAARGLAAAHEAGVVHRDIKPANILVGVDGRPRIADFGLARAVADVGLEDASQDDAPSPGVTLSRSGEIVGTPAYMAPEQFEGTSDDASDQWSLCAAFWEAAYGERPFSGRGIAELSAAVLGPLRSPPPGRGEVPEWWRRILARGLSLDPTARWPSVAALALALERATGRRRRRGLALAGLGTMLAGLTAAGAWQLDRDRRRARCDDEAAAIAEVWNDEVASRLHDAIAGTGLSYAETTVALAGRHLDTYADDWRSRWAQSCRDTEVDARRPPELWSASRACLHERLGELRALLEVLTDHPDANTVQQTVPAVAGLGRLDACFDDRHLAGYDADDREVAGEQLARLWRAHALTGAGRYAEGLELAESLCTDTADHPSTRLRVRALLVAGDLGRRTGAFEAAETRLGDAFDQALAAGEHDLALASASHLVALVGNGMDRYDEGLWWGRMARGLHAYVGHDDDLEAAGLRTNLGEVYRKQARYALAMSEHEGALAIWEKVLGPQHPSVAIAHNNVGTVYLAQGRYADAESAFARASEALERALGPDHPRVAKALGNLAVTLFLQARYAEAVSARRRALDIAERALGSEHPDVGALYSALGDDHLGQQEHAAAEEAYQRGLGILGRALGPDHPKVGHPHTGLGRLFFAQERYDDAEREFTAAVAIQEKALGADHPQVADSYENLGSTYHAQGRHAEAVRVLQRVLSSRQQAGRAEHPRSASTYNNLGEVYAAQGSLEEAEDAYAKGLAIAEKTDAGDEPVATSLEGLAEVRLRLHRPGDAVVAAERALSIRTQNGGDALDLADLRFVLARALTDSGVDLARARALAEQARDAYRDAGEAHAETLARVDDWLARHRRAP